MTPNCHIMQHADIAVPVWRWDTLFALLLFLHQIKKNIKWSNGEEGGMLSGRYSLDPKVTEIRHKAVFEARKNNGKMRVSYFLDFRGISFEQIPNLEIYYFIQQAKRGALYQVTTCYSRVRNTKSKALHKYFNENTFDENCLISLSLLC